MRSLPSELRAACKLNLKISFVSEFFAGPLSSTPTVEDCRWEAYWIRNDKVGQIDAQLRHFSTTCEGRSENGCNLGKSSVEQQLITVLVPDEPGQYSLRLSCTAPNLHDTDTALLLLPVISHSVKVTLSPNGGMPTLGCLREVPLSRQADRESICIHEEYGATLGSHVWDSSIILTRYIHTLFCHTASSPSAPSPSPPSSSTLYPFLSCLSIPSKDSLAEKYALELGAGLGLCGVSLAIHRVFRKVFISDKMEQCKYIQRNIALHACEETARACSLDYMDPTRCVDNLASMVAEEGGGGGGGGDSDGSLEGSLALVLAADVLYHYDTALRFMSTAHLVRVTSYLTHSFENIVEGEALPPVFFPLPLFPSPLYIFRFCRKRQFPACFLLHRR